MVAYNAAEYSPPDLPSPDDLAWYTDAYQVPDAGTYVIQQSARQRVNNVGNPQGEAVLALHRWAAAAPPPVNGGDGLVAFYAFQAPTMANSSQSWWLSGKLIVTIVAGDWIRWRGANWRGIGNALEPKASHRILEIQRIA